MGEKGSKTTQAKSLAKEKKARAKRKKDLASGKLTPGGTPGAQFSKGVRKLGKKKGRPRGAKGTKTSGVTFGKKKRVSSRKKTTTKKKAAGGRKKKRA